MVVRREVVCNFHDVLLRMRQKARLEWRLEVGDLFPGRRGTLHRNGSLRPAQRQNCQGVSEWCGDFKPCCAVRGEVFVRYSRYHLHRPAYTPPP